LEDKKWAQNSFLVSLELLTIFGSILNQVAEERGNPYINVINVLTSINIAIIAYRLKSYTYIKKSLTTRGNPCVVTHILCNPEFKYEDEGKSENRDINIAN